MEPSLCLTPLRRQRHRPYSINDNGFITGSLRDSNEALRGFVRSPDGTIVEFDIPGDVNGIISSSINNTGLSSVILRMHRLHSMHSCVQSAARSLYSMSHPATGRPCRRWRRASVQMVPSGVYLDGKNERHGFAWMSAVSSSTSRQPVHRQPTITGCRDTVSSQGQVEVRLLPEVVAPWILFG